MNCSCIVSLITLVNWARANASPCDENNPHSILLGAVEAIVTARFDVAAMMWRAAEYLVTEGGSPATLDATREAAEMLRALACKVEMEEFSRV